MAIRDVFQLDLKGQKFIMVETSREGFIVFITGVS